MTTARMTLGSVLGTVNSAATSVQSVFDTTTKGINMLNKYVSDAAEKQMIRSKIDMHDFTTKLVEEKAMEETLRKKEILEFCNADKENKELYEAAFNRLQKVLENN